MLRNSFQIERLDIGQIEAILCRLKMSTKSVISSRSLRSTAPKRDGKGSLPQKGRAVLLAELKTLNGRYHKLEESEKNLNLKLSTFEGGPAASRSAQLVAFLRRTKADLQLDLTNVTCPRMLKKDREVKRKIIGVIAEYENILCSLEICTKLLDETGTNLDKVLQRLVDRKAEVQRIFGGSLDISGAERSTERLEKRLYSVVSQCDQMMARNRKLKEDIGLLLKRRGIFFQKYFKSKSKIRALAGKTMNLALSASKAYDDRDELRRETLDLTDDLKKESRNFHCELREFNRARDHDTKLHQFMILKNQERDKVEEAVDSEMRRVTRRLTNLGAELQDYRLSFRRIFKLANNSWNVDILIREYSTLEASNLAQFKSISEVDQVTLSIHDKILRKARYIEKINEKRKAREVAWEETLSQLDGEVDSKRGQLDDLTTKWKEVQEEEGKFLGDLGLIFKEAGCEDCGIIQLLGWHQGTITPRNAELCVATLEKQISKLVHVKRKLELRSAFEVQGKPLPPKKGVHLMKRSSKSAGHGGPFSPSIHIIGHRDDENEFDRKPLSYEEMKSVLMEMMDNPENDLMVGASRNDQ